MQSWEDKVQFIYIKLKKRVYLGIEFLDIHVFVNSYENKPKAI
jgi:hypothetical protein